METNESAGRSGLAHKSRAEQRTSELEAAMTRSTKSTKRLTIVAVLAIALAGCSAMLAGVPAWRTSAPPASGRAIEAVASSSTGVDQQRADKARIQATLGKLPLYFVRNRGQEDPRVAYYLQGHNTAVYFGRDGITFALTSPKSQAGEERASSRVPVRLVSTNPERPAAAERWAVKLDFVGANRVTPAGQELAPAVISHFTGRDGHWSGSAETYRSVTYAELWPGIDLVYTGAGGQLKSTFMVKPGADPNQIRLAYRGATGVRLTETGQLEVSTPVGSFADDRPYAYQDGSGDRTEVPVAFALAAPADGAQGYSFRVGGYDRSKTLVLDPSFLVYAGYIGGSGVDDAHGIAVDAAGNAYVVGTTTSLVPSFPAKVGPDLTYNGGFDGDVFVAKVKADGSDLVYLGYIGGTGTDAGTAIAVDAAGNAYVTGYTTSNQTSFPVKVGPGLTHSGLTDAFVAKVKADGTALVYCGYIGGTDEDLAYGIAVDKLGNAYVTGWTSSDETSFPVKGGPGLTYQGGTDAFVAKVKADGTTLIYAGYIGGADDDFGNAVAVDAAGNAYVTGKTESDQITFPVKVGPDLNYNGATDGFVAKVKADGTALVYAGYIGGSGLDIAYAIAVDVAGNAYVAGVTTSDQATFPVKVGPDLSHSGYSDAFVAKVKADGTGLVYAGYIGGAGEEHGYGIAVDAAGDAYVTGDTTSDEATFPVKLGPSLHFSGAHDAFVAKVKADGTGLLWAGYIGGNDLDEGYAIAVDSTGNAYVTGVTSSSQASFPVTVGPDLIYGNGSSDAFVAKVSGKPDLWISSVVLISSSTSPGGTLKLSDTASNKGLGTAPPSATRYYLSTDTFKASYNSALLGGSRAVPSLLPGATSSSVTTTLTVPNTLATGLYFLFACADDTSAIGEVNDTNNCSDGYQVHVHLPDLAEVVVSPPPSFAKPGDKFVVVDTVQNLMPRSAAASTTRYYLSTDTTKGTGDVLLSGSRAVPALTELGTPGDHSVGGATVTIPATTAVGVYYVVACADDLKSVKEEAETNNCLASSSTIVVTLPDLRTSGVSSPAASVKRGHSLSVTDTVTNVANVSAVASTTRYYLSTDITKSTNDILLTGTRAVGALVAGGPSTGTVTVTVPSTLAPGPYYLFACADDFKVVKELSEINNCGHSASPITITQ
jgi:hypothetical protein